MKITKENLENKFSEISKFNDYELKLEIDGAVRGVYDELKVLIEQMTCNSKMNNNYLQYEARFQESFNELRWLCYEKMKRGL